MATSPIYGWAEPDNTDLVKNGALAIRTLGNAIDTTMATMTPKSTYTAKGSIAAATAASTPANLAVGNNGETLVADSSTSTGLRYQGLFGANKNKIINGDFGINQRNFTSNTADGAYNFDRWLQAKGGASGTLTVTPQTFALGTAPVAGYEGKNYVQCVTASGASTDTYAILGQKIESVRTFANQTVTISFWAKAGSATPKITVELGQVFGGGGGSTAVTTNAGQVTTSTSWARYSVSVALPSIAGKTIGTNGDDNLTLFFWLSAGSDFNARVSNLGLQNNTFQIWGVQVEAGSVATPFQTATGTIQGELAACQRYYWRQTPSSGVNYTNFSPLGIGLGAAGANIVLQFPVTMRVSPTAIEYSSNLRVDDNYASSATVSSITLDSTTSSVYLATLSAATSTSTTVGRPYRLQAANSNATYVAVTAEL